MSNKSIRIQLPNRIDIQNSELQRQNLLNRDRQTIRETIRERQRIRENLHLYQPVNYHIFAYCSKNYLDAYEFVIDSWLRSNVDSVTIYTDFPYKDLKRPNVKFIQLFQDTSDNWIIGTGRRLDVIKHYNSKFESPNKNILFMDIDCLIVDDPSRLFHNKFDIAISRLGNQEGYAKKTATAGLWFAKHNPRYIKFCTNWSNMAAKYFALKKGIIEHRISYVQYSFTDTARKHTPDYDILSIDEKIYNSEHSSLDRWYHDVEKFKPKILHFKGRRFRDQEIIQRVMQIVGQYKK